MDNPIPALAFGAFLLVVGGAMLAMQRKASRNVEDQAENKREHRFLARRIRRRTQVAGLILLIGLMIPVGDMLIPWEKRPGTFAVYWMVVIGLAIWTIVLAMGDIASTRMHVSIELNQLRRQQRELEEAARRLQQEQQRNGSGEH
jgi:hypothetical protein